MPNHITNVLRVSAYEYKGVPAGLIDELIEAVKGKDTPFDFNRILPMPDELQIDASTTTEMAQALFDDAAAFKFMHYPWIIEAGVTDLISLRKFLRERYPQHPHQGFATLDELSSRVRSNIDQYGRSTWYSWCCDHWGTKWNAYSAIAGKNGDRECFFHFETAWRPPLPVLDKLAEAFPQANIRLIWLDEGDDKYHSLYWENGKREVDE